MLEQALILTPGGWNSALSPVAMVKVESVCRTMSNVSLFVDLVLIFLHSLTGEFYNPRPGSTLLLPQGSAHNERSLVSLGPWQPQLSPLASLPSRGQSLPPIPTHPSLPHPLAPVLQQVEVPYFLSSLSEPHSQLWLAFPKASCTYYYSAGAIDPCYALHVVCPFQTHVEM